MHQPTIERRLRKLIVFLKLLGSLRGCGCGGWLVWLVGAGAAAEAVGTAGTYEARRSVLRSGLRGQRAADHRNFERSRAPASDAEDADVGIDVLLGA